MKQFFTIYHLPFTIYQVFILLLILSLSSCSLFKVKTPPYPDGITFPMEKIWENSFESGPIEVIHREKNNLYFSTREGKVICFNIEAKKAAWVFQVKGKIESPLYRGQDNFYVHNENGLLYCLSLQGKLIWKTKIGDKITSGIYESGSRVYIGTEKGKLIAFNEKGEKLWFFKSGGEIKSIPIVAASKVIFGCDDGKVYFINTDGILISTCETEGKVRGSFLVDNNLLYFGSYDHYFYCFDIKKHKVKWRIKTGGIINSFPVFWGKRIYFLSYNNVLYCLNKKNGTIIWWAPVPARSFFRLEFADDKIVVSSMSDNLMCFDAKTGEHKGSYNALWEAGSNPLWVDPNLIISVYDENEETAKLLFMQKEVKVSLSASKTSPQNVNEEIVFTADVTGFYLPQYEFYSRRFIKINFSFFPLLMVPVNLEREIVQAKSEENTWICYPEDEGIYRIEVLVEDEKEKSEAEMYFKITKSDEEDVNKNKGDLGMSRNEAFELVKKYLKNKNLVKHSLAVEACMRALAEKLGEDVEKWGLAGILHDIDYEITEKDPEKHTVEAVKILEEFKVGSDIIYAIQAHAGNVPCKSKMDWAIFSIDPLTGLIIAATLMHPNKKLEDVELGFIQRRYKEKSFARGAKREDIEQIANIEMELDEFISICLKAMQGISKELGL